MQKCTIQQENHVKNVKSKIVRLSIYYFLVTLTYSSFSSVIIYLHQKYKHKGFGQAYLTANSLASIVIYMFCPYILSRVSFTSNKLLILCTMGYFINVFLPSVFAFFDSADGKAPPTHFRFGFQILGNLLGGGASGIFMVLNGRYLTQICKNVQQKGYYFGVANAIMNARTVVAPIVTMVGLGMGNEAIYFVLLSGIILASLPFPLLLIPTIKLNCSQENSQNQSIQQDSTSICRNLISYFKFFKQFKLLIPSLILAGSMAGFVSSSISHLLPKAPKGENNDNLLGFVLIWVGLGNVFGGYANGWIADKFSMKVSSFVGHFALAIASLLTCLYFTVNSFLWGACLIGFLSGYSFSHIFSLISLMCTVYFKGSSQSFSVSKQVPILSYISYQWMVAFLNNTCNMDFNMKYQSIFMIVPAVIGMYCMNRSCDQKEKNMEKINEENMSTVGNIGSETPGLSNEIMMEEV